MGTIEYDDSRGWYKTGKHRDRAEPVRDDVTCPLCGGEREDGSRSLYCGDCYERTARDVWEDDGEGSGLFDDPDAVYLSEYEEE